MRLENSILQSPSNGTAGAWRAQCKTPSVRDSLRAAAIRRQVSEPPVYGALARSILHVERWIYSVGHRVDKRRIHPVESRARFVGVPQRHRCAAYSDAPFKCRHFQFEPPFLCLHAAALALELLVFVLPVFCRPDGFRWRHWREYAAGTGGGCGIFLVCVQVTCPGGALSRSRFFAKPGGWCLLAGAHGSCRVAGLILRVCDTNRRDLCAT
ncbi:hypothetical protein C8R47DRAFT_1099431 [Mycena vitilis]|nr:hypothetical protein C8R47DRAFT_1099431 [Mycena vitilis]